MIEGDREGSYLRPAAPGCGDVRPGLPVRLVPSLKVIELHRRSGRVLVPGATEDQDAQPPGLVLHYSTAKLSPRHLQVGQSHPALVRPNLQLLKCCQVQTLPSFRRYLTA